MPPGTERDESEEGSAREERLTGKILSPVSGDTIWNPFGDEISIDWSLTDKCDVGVSNETSPEILSTPEIVLCVK